MALAEVIQGVASVRLVPRSGIQFLDFGFRLAGPPPILREWGVFEDRAARLNDETLPELLWRDEPTPGAKEAAYTLAPREVVAALRDVWLPVPLLREEAGGGYHAGPTNWARARLVPLAKPDADGADHRLVLAIDTDLEPQVAGSPYTAPSIDDAREGRPFSLPPAGLRMGWFYRQAWVREWCFETLRERKEAEVKARSRQLNRPRLTPEELLEAFAGRPNLHVAMLMALVDLIHAAQVVPRIVMIDRHTDPRPAPVDVDMVLDLGNSRTCGLMIEAQPDQRNPDLAKAFALNLRDLDRPELVHREPFDSRIEFARARFGRDELSMRSGRADAFSWPSVVRVGAEAARLAGRRRGTEGATGMSSPKRYLWDETGRRQGWRFNQPESHGEAAPLVSNTQFTTLVNELGEPLHRLPRGPNERPEARFPSMRGQFARSHLMTFGLAEIFLHAMVQINSVAHRLRRQNAELPRRLRRIVMTMPTAMPLAERQLLRRRAQAAIELVFLALGLARDDGDERQPPTATGDDPLPQVVLRWDEATAAQAVWLYANIAQNHSGDARTFFQTARHPANRATASDGDAFRLATLDIGGGTTDLIVTRFAVEGTGANVTVQPDQLFRESFGIAGDDLLLRVVQDHVVPPIRRALDRAGLGEAAETLLQRLFGGDDADKTEPDRMRRQRFASQVAMPIALALLHDYERHDPVRPPAVAHRLLGDFLDPATGAGDVLAQVDDAIRKAGLAGFALASLPVPVDPTAIGVTVEAVFREMLAALAEVAWRYRVDMLLLSGRPSRLPAVRAMLIETGALAPTRIVPMSGFRVGAWYPFRDAAGRIADAKTAAAVGAMICRLAEADMPDFHYDSQRLRPASTARFFGKLDRGGRLGAADVYFGDLRLDDPDWRLPEDQGFAFRSAMTLGFRQFAADWWPATPLYAIDYASEADGERLKSKVPLAVGLKRGKDARDVSDRFEIARIERADGGPVARQQNDDGQLAWPLSLKLRTLVGPGDYWLDSGILVAT